MILRWTVATAVALALSAPAHAQAAPDDIAELDGMAIATAEAGSGVALARRQIGEGDLLGAAATLERVLLAHPATDPVLLLHASLLCRLDDPQGAQLELAPLKGRPITREAWAEALAACGAGAAAPASVGGR